MINGSEEVGADHPEGVYEDALDDVHQLSRSPSQPSRYSRHEQCKLHDSYAEQSQLQVRPARFRIQARDCQASQLLSAFIHGIKVLQRVREKVQHWYLNDG